MAATTPSSEQCAVCATRATSRCGACKAVRFCSKRCQTLLWPTHKVLCGRDPDVFYLPPLTDKELAMVCDNKHRRPLGPGEPSFYEDILQDGETWEDFVASLTTADARPRPGLESLAEARDHRLLNLNEAYRFLAFLTHPPFAPGSVERARCAWYFFAASTDAVRTMYIESWQVPEGAASAARASDEFALEHLWVLAGSCTILNQLYRQLLINMTLCVWAIAELGSPLITSVELDTLMACGEQRALEAVDAADIMPQAARSRFRTALDGSFRRRQRQHRSL